MAGLPCFFLACQRSASRWPRRLKRNTAGIGWASAEILDAYSLTSLGEAGRSTTYYYSFAFEAKCIDGSSMRVEAYDQLGNCGCGGPEGSAEVAYLHANPLDFWLTAASATNSNKDIDTFTSNPFFISVGAIFVTFSFFFTQVLPVMSSVVYSESAVGLVTSLSCYFVLLGFVVLSGHWSGRTGQRGRCIVLAGTRRRLVILRGAALESWCGKFCGSPRFSDMNGATQDAELAELLGGPHALEQKLSRLDDACLRLVRCVHWIFVAAAALPWALAAATWPECFANTAQCSKPLDLLCGIHVSLWICLWLFQFVWLRSPMGLFQKMAVRCLGLDRDGRIARMRFSSRDSGENCMPVLVFTIDLALVEAPPVTQTPALMSKRFEGEESIHSVLVNPMMLGSCELFDFKCDINDTSCETRGLL